MNYVAKYQIDDAIHQIKNRYPDAFHKPGKLEDFVPANDPAMVKIRLFRNAIKTSEKQRQTVTKKIVKPTEVDWYLNKGYAPGYMSNLLGVATKDVMKVINQSQKRRQLYKRVIDNWHKVIAYDEVTQQTEIFRTASDAANYYRVDRRHILNMLSNPQYFRSIKGRFRFKRLVLYKEDGNFD